MENPVPYAIETRTKFPSHSPAPQSYLQGVPVDRILEDGEVIAGRLQVIHTPGHDDDCVCWYDIPTGTLITGDSLQGNGTPAQGIGFYKDLESHANSLFYLFFGVIINMVMTIPAAYALSKQHMKGRNAIMMMIAFTMYFSGGLIPHYLMVRDLGLINTRAVVLLEGAVTTTNLIIARTYFSSSIPKELEEAAEIDGCSGPQVFLRIVLPLSKAMLGVILLYYAVARWNNYTSSLYYGGAGCVFQGTAGGGQPPAAAEKCVLYAPCRRPYQRQSAHHRHASGRGCAAFCRGKPLQYEISGEYAKRMIKQR